MKTLVQWLEATFAYQGRDVSLFEAALTHRSAGNPHNERLEFLGDAVLNCVTATLLYKHFRHATEGELSRYRATLVSGESLAAIAAELGVGEYLRMGQGELKSGGFRRKSILADALEAILGAIYMDSSFSEAERVIERLFATRLPQLPQAALLKDPKTKLQEALQSRAVPLPEYLIESVSGEAHAQYFRVRCDVASLNLRSHGEGGSRRAAEQDAAQHIFEQLNQLWGK
jgi:ribonuclease III